MSAVRSITTVNAGKLARRQWANCGLMQRSKAYLFDHLVGAAEQRDRDSEAERLGDLHVDHEPVLDGPLHRQLARLSTLKDSIDIAGRAAIFLDLIHTVGGQTTVFDKDRVPINRGQFV